MPIRTSPVSLVSLVTLIPIAALFIAGCAGVPPAPPAEASAMPELVGAFAEPLVRAEVAVERGAVRSAYGCQIGYEYYDPAPVEAASDFAGPRPLVVLAHGFMRSTATIRGWADAWASRGVRTVAVDFCNSGPFNGRHDRNAEDLVAVAHHLEPGDAPIIYAGFSAGGLSALLAAAADPRTVAYMGLDAVDSNGLAAQVDRLRAPALFLAGEPTSCNAYGNMLDTLPRASRLVVLRIPGASHCDFENPTTRFCTFLCGTGSTTDAVSETRATIRALATAWVEAYAGVSPESQAVFHRATIDSLAAGHRVIILRSE
jgi:pimeloyl-ACP methyl ester carboxylesterase